MSIGEKIREKYDWCSSFLTISHHPGAITENVDMCVEGEFAVKENFEPPDDFGRFYDACWCQETRTPVIFFPISSLWTLSFLLSPTTFPLNVLPNRLHSPPSLVFIVASSLM